MPQETNNSKFNRFSHYSWLWRR